MCKLTVLMTTYNEEKNIFETAIESIINQTLKDIKILIIVDNPKNSEIIDTIEKYAKKDSRIKYVINEKNLGLPLALNRGIELIDTEYIARMDSDDIASKNRLEKQLQYAIENPDIDLFGTNIKYMDYNSNVLYERGKLPTDYNVIREVMKYVNVFNHPTFFGKTEIFKTYKYRNLKYSQDYDFVCRLLEDGHKVQNMPEYLLDYRLPCKENEKKVVRQKITYYCVQKNYSKKTLNNVNIQEQVKKELVKVNEKKLLKAINLYNEALKTFKKGNKLKFIILILKSFVLSRYTRKQVINTSKYYIIMKKNGEKNENKGKYEKNIA